MSNKLHTDALVPPIMESLVCKDLVVDTQDMEAATRTISATAEASGLASADYHYHGAFGTPADARVAIRNLISVLFLTIDSDDGTHDLRARVYIDAQDTDHMMFDVTCSATGVQNSYQSLNSSTLATIFNLIKDGTTHTYYVYFWSPGNHSPVISLVNVYAACGSNNTNTTGVSAFTFTSPVNCEIQIRHASNVSPSPATGMTWAFINGIGYYDAGFAITDAGALTVAAVAGSSSPGSWTWQIMPAGQQFALHSKTSTAAAYHTIPDVVIFIKRWS